MNKMAVLTIGLGAALLAGIGIGCRTQNTAPAGVAPVAPPTQATDHAADEAAADKAAQAWLALIDRAQYAQSWKTAAPAFQKAASKDFWATTIGAVRSPLGKLQKRTRISAQYSSSLPGAPDGEYVVLQYQSAFAKKKSAIETVTPQRDKNGQWKVSGYYLK